MKRYFVDMSHTAHSAARTGVQRVTRCLATALGGNAVPMTLDPYEGAWRELRSWEKANLEKDTGPAKRRGASWPVFRQWQSRLGKLSGASNAGAIDPQPEDGLIVPEIFSAAVAGAFGKIFPRIGGPRVAIFHDAIALQLPELTPPGTVARFPHYLHELLRFDGIAAVSEASRDTLLEFWRWLEIPSPPPVVAIPLGIDIPAEQKQAAAISRFHPHLDGMTAANDRPTLLCVATIEGRKNHLSLLAAAEKLWQQGEKFSLRLIGTAHRETGAAALKTVETLRAAGRPIFYAGAVSDTALDTAYRECAFTVYPSWQEGFGLPVLESLARGKACVCSGRGALGEASRGGGCLTVDRPDAASLADALRRLLGDAEERTRLEAAARARTFRSWNDYAHDITTWMTGLARRELG